MDPMAMGVWIFKLEGRVEHRKQMQRPGRVRPSDVVTIQYDDDVGLLQAQWRKVLSGCAIRLDVWSQQTWRGPRNCTKQCKIRELHHRNGASWDALSPSRRPGGRRRISTRAIARSISKGASPQRS